MEAVISHPWNVTIQKAKEIQLSLSKRVLLKPLLKKVLLLAAVDVSYTRWDKQGYAVLGIFSIRYDNSDGLIRIKEEVIYTRKDRVNFPYVPGYLSFREIPMLLPLFEKVDIKPDVLLVDGVGIAHPRRFGLAAHLGVLYDIPSIGCAKSRLVGMYEEPDSKKGSLSKLVFKREEVGVVLRSKDNCKPLFVSPGNKCNVESAANLVLKCCSKYRLADPIRRVDAISKEIRKGDNSSSVSRQYSNQSLSYSDGTIERGEK